MTRKLSFSCHFIPLSVITLYLISALRTYNASCKYRWKLSRRKLLHPDRWEHAHKHIQPSQKRLQRMGEVEKIRVLSLFQHLSGQTINDGPVTIELQSYSVFKLGFDAVYFQKTLDGTGGRIKLTEVTGGEWHPRALVIQYSTFHSLVPFPCISTSYFKSLSLACIKCLASSRQGEKRHASNA